MWLFCFNESFYYFYMKIKLFHFTQVKILCRSVCLWSTAAQWSEGWFVPSWSFCVLLHSALTLTNEHSPPGGIIQGKDRGDGVSEVETDLKGGKLKDAQRLQASREGERCLKHIDGIWGRNSPKESSVGIHDTHREGIYTKTSKMLQLSKIWSCCSDMWRKRRCARCGEDHEDEQCGEGMEPNCCHCGGNHSVAYGGCEVMKREVEIQQVRVQN